MKIYNSLSRQVEEFVPINPPTVGMYTCGPTVYAYPHIGNWRTFVLGDLIVRTLHYLGYQPRYLMNITDVGHLTGDNLGDSSAGEDRLEKASRLEGKTAWDIAAFYTQDFITGYEKLNLSWPLDKQFCKATDHIAEQVSLIQRIEKNGFTYKIADGIYFDVKAYEQAGNIYGLMSNIHIDTAVERIAANVDKKDKRDFALWKLTPPGEKRHMEWDSPWGKGFPGWHIECSAMSMKYLGEQFDLHVGGEDHKSTHHPNEIAQSEAATGKKPFVKYWVHGAFLLVDGGRMGKSKGNAYTLQDLEAKGFEPLSLRYFYLTGHYRKQLNFTWEALTAAQTAHKKLKSAMASFVGEQDRNMLSDEKLAKINEFRSRFRAHLDNDLNLPEAIAVVWEVVKSNIPSTDKYDLIREFDEVLGLRLDLTDNPDQPEQIPEQVTNLMKQRENFRQTSKFAEADSIRLKIEELGYLIEDTPQGSRVIRK